MDRPNRRGAGKSGSAVSDLTLAGDKPHANSMSRRVTSFSTGQISAAAPFHVHSICRFLKMTISDQHLL